MEVYEKFFKDEKITYKIACPEEYSETEKNDVVKHILKYYNASEKEINGYKNEIVGVCYVGKIPVAVCIYANNILNGKKYYGNVTYSHKSYVKYNNFFWSFVNKCDKFVEKNNEKIRNLNGIVHDIVNKRWLKFSVSKRGMKFWEKNGYHLLINNKASAMAYKTFNRRSENDNRNQ